MARLSPPRATTLPLGSRGDGDGDGHQVLRCGGFGLRGAWQVAEFGGDAVAFALQAEGIAVGVVEAAVLACEGRHDMHLAGLVAQGDPAAGVRIAVGRDGDRRNPAGDFCPLSIGQIAVARGRADRADPHRPLGRPGAETLHGRVQSIGQVGQGVRAGEQVDRGTVAVPAHQTGVALIAVFARPEQVGEQAGSVAGPLKVSDHGVDLEGERRELHPGDRASGREDPHDPRFGPPGNRWYEPARSRGRSCGRGLCRQVPSRRQRRGAPPAYEELSVVPATVSPN